MAAARAPHTLRAMLLDIAIVFAVVFAVNLLPAFGPPTWTVLVALKLGLDVAAVPLVAAGALAAASGRWALAHGAWLLRGRMSDKRRASLEALRAAVFDRPAGAIAGLILFALSPIPSAQLFVAAGLTGMRLGPLVLAFFSGRVVSYSLYVGAATAAAMLAMLVVLLRVDWAAFLGRHRRHPGPPAAPVAT
jgi:uncharacterized membrane protein YdjX (TVP38/TMEM64 family)